MLLMFGTAEPKMHHYKSTKHPTTYKSKFSPKDFDRALLARSKVEYSRELDIPDIAVLRALYNLQRALCPDFLIGCDCGYELVDGSVLGANKI